MVKNLSVMQETSVQSLGREYSLPTPVFLPGEFHGWRSLAGYSPQSCKESDKTERISPAHIMIEKIKTTR